MTDIFPLMRVLTLYLNIDQCSIFLRKFLNVHFNLEILFFFSCNRRVLDLFKNTHRGAQLLTKEHIQNCSYCSFY